MREHEIAIAEYIMLQLLEVGTVGTSAAALLTPSYTQWQLKLSRTHQAFQEKGWACHEPAFHCHREGRRREVRAKTEHSHDKA